MKTEKKTRRTLERQLARELSAEELKKAMGGVKDIGTTTCCNGCADD